MAFHFPPMAGSSGLLRALNFTRDLPALGWIPVVLSAHPRAYERTSDELLATLPAGVEVVRAFALDAKRHLAIRGRYLSALALPDRWVSWVLGGVPAGLRIVRSHRPAVIWSTYPLASAHIIGWMLHRLTGIPWVADFRDPMVEQDSRNGAWTPGNPVLRAVRLWVERRCALHAARLVFCSEAAKQICVGRYGDAIERRCHVIHNGYDEELFGRAEARRGFESSSPNQRFILLHSGIVYPTSDRDPSAFLDALAKLKRMGVVGKANFQVVLRATGHDDWLRAKINERDCQDLVSLKPALSYQAALEEMLRADGLLVFQGYTSNPAIPAKIYEYIRAGKPILGLVDHAGATADLMRRASLGVIGDIASARDIEVKLAQFIADVRANRLRGLPSEAQRKFSRRHGAKVLAELFTTLYGSECQARAECA